MARKIAILFISLLTLFGLMQWKYAILNQQSNWSLRVAANAYQWSEHKIAAQLDRQLELNPLVGRDVSLAMEKLAGGHLVKHETAQLANASSLEEIDQVLMPDGQVVSLYVDDGRMTRFSSVFPASATPPPPPRPDLRLPVIVLASLGVMSVLAWLVAIVVAVLEKCSRRKAVEVSLYASYAMVFLLPGLFSTPFMYGMSAAMLISGFFRLYLVHQPSPPAHCCHQCGYNLTGNLSGICPECGQPCPSQPPGNATPAS